MWAIENQTSFSAERAFLRDVNGAEVWIVMVRGTYDILPNGRLELAQEQVPVAMAPEFLGDPGSSGLRWDTDLVLAKPTTDVIVLGQAYAPPLERVRELEASLDVGPLHKSLRVLGDRRWVRQGDELVLTAPEPFVSMPLTWERAYGGTDEQPEDDRPFLEPRNPVGTGFVLERDRLEGRLAPNVLSLNADESLPAGFGAIPRHWQPRLAYAGTFDESWQETRMPVLPEDFDLRFFQCAPADQQPEIPLRGGERVVLKNLTMSGELSFELPLVRLGFQTTFFNEVVEHRAALHTVIIEPDLPRLQMVWHTRLDCHPRVYKLLKTTITEKIVGNFSDEDAGEHQRRKSA
jgi:hypothetical protein